MQMGILFLRLHNNGAQNYVRERMGVMEFQFFNDDAATNILA